MMLNSITLHSPGQIAFHIGFWPIRWYGIFIGTGFLIAYSFAEKIIKKTKLNSSHFSDMILVVLIFSVAFARLYFVFLSWDYFKLHLDEIPKIWYGGQSIHGGMFGAILGAFLYAKIKKISFYSYMDVIAVISPLGQAIGRWGNFFNNEAFGKPVREGLPFPFGFLRLYIPDKFRPDQYLNIQYFHPMFLYESFLDFVLFVFLYKKYVIWKEKPGKTFWSYLLGYSVIRFFLEFLRSDSLYLFDHIASAHVISVSIFLISTLVLVSKRYKCVGACHSKP